MKQLIRFICGTLYKALRSRPSLAMLAAAGVGTASVLVLVKTDATPELTTGQANSVLFHTRETPKTRQEERPDNHEQPPDYTLALAKTFTLEKGIERECRVRDLLSRWAARDAEAALNWVAALKDPTARRSTRFIICQAVAQEDPRRAIALALAPQSNEEDDGGLLEYLTMQWCEKESATALDWIHQQPPGVWRDRLLAKASFVLSKSDPAAAAYLVSSLEPGNLQNEAAMAVLHQWALIDYDSALHWAEAFPEPKLRERAFAEISNLRNLSAALELEQ